MLWFLNHSFRVNYEIIAMELYLITRIRYSLKAFNALRLNFKQIFAFAQNWQFQKSTDAKLYYRPSTLKSTEVTVSIMKSAHMYQIVCIHV